MSLLSLLIALAAEKSLSSSVWCFDYYYQRYINLFSGNATLSQHNGSVLGSAIFILLPVLIVHLALSLVDDGLLYFIISTLVLIVCFGCAELRGRYKDYLQALQQGEETTAELHHQQLLQDKNLPAMSFGQVMIWLNYRYYIAIMLFFVFFGAAGVVFYRLLTTVIEQRHENSIESTVESPTESGNADAEISTSPVTHNDDLSSKSADVDQTSELNEPVQETEASEQAPDITSGCKNHRDVLFYLDWIPVRIATLGYMFVGHFSKALPTWLENLYDLRKPAHKILIDVAKKSEDIMISKENCTAEPCTLVRLAKRTVLLILAVVSVLILMGAL